MLQTPPSHDSHDQSPGPSWALFPGCPGLVWMEGPVLTGLGRAALGPATDPAGLAGPAWAGWMA